MMGKKVTVGYTSLTSCTGCEIAFLDINEKILDVLSSVDLVYTPMVMDYRKVPDNIDLLFVEGSVSTDHDLRELLEYRKKAKNLVAVGACACFGGIPGMRNFFSAKEILDHVYPSDEDTVEFQGPTNLLPKVKSVPMLVDTDFLLPGCPPLPENFLTVVGNYPNFNKIVLPTKTLCAECDLKKDKLLSPIREFTSLKIRNPYKSTGQDDMCFLERGALCMGVATRAGCGGRCVKVNVPCRGCFGPPPQEGSEDQGAGVISAISSILPTGRLLTKEDIIGLVYRYSLSVITDLQEYSHTSKEE
jgi:F420-non-reducing hydrogenase small subunit